mgnify:CR=1 FL=1
MFIMLPGGLAAFADGGFGKCTECFFTTPIGNKRRCISFASFVSLVSLVSFVSLNWLFFSIFLGCFFFLTDSTVLCGDFFFFHIALAAIAGGGGGGKEDGVLLPFRMLK